MKKLVLILMFNGLLVSGFSQNIAINQDGSQPDTSAMLDISSSNKGLLMPRLTTAQQASITLPATGLMHFNSSLNAFQANVGTPVSPNWTSLSTSKERSNFVLVKTATDLPAPISGIITLAASTIYEINGTILLTSKINLNGSWITGVDAVNDKLVYTPSSGELFTGANGGNIRSLTLTANTAGSKLFNLDAAGANKNFIIQNCYILGCDNIGIVRGYAGSVYFQTIGLFYNNNGITFQDDNNVIIANALWDQSNHNTFETYLGTFSVIQKTAGAMQALSANSATAMDVTGISSIIAGELKVVLFTGTGNYINGSFSNAWEVEATGLSTEKDDVATGNVYLTTPIQTTFTASNTPTKVGGNTTSVGLFRVSSLASNRLTYTGTKTRRFSVNASLSVSSLSANKYYSFYIFKNGVIMPESEQAMRLSTGVDKGSLTLTCTVQLASNDYVEIWAANTTDNSSMTVETLNLSIK